MAIDDRRIIQGVLICDVKMTESRAEHCGNRVPGMHVLLRAICADEWLQRPPASVEEIMTMLLMDTYGGVECLIYSYVFFLQEYYKNVQEHVFSMSVGISLSEYYNAYDEMIQNKELEFLEQTTRRTTLDKYISVSKGERFNGFQLMDKCRHALDAIDRRGWQRSFHQRMFHDNFIRACSRIFWKREADGSFAKNHQKILEINGWDHISQEILVSTPRR